jgi:thiamine kinase-like enzyme
MLIRIFSHGVSTERVELHERNGQKLIFKFLKTENKALREIQAYKELIFCPFVPKMIQSSIDDKLIITEYKGYSLNLKYSPKERKQFKTRIQEMNHELIHTYGVHHNDIRWKNVVESDSGELFLIDFESWTPFSHGSRERDPEKILS